MSELTVGAPAPAFSAPDQSGKTVSLSDFQGKTVILVTHKLREIMAVTDRVTVMRQGAVVHETATAATSPRALAEAMVGRAVLLQVDKSPARPGAPVLEVARLEVSDRFGVPRRVNTLHAPGHGMS